MKLQGLLKESAVGRNAKQKWGVIISTLIMIILIIIIGPMDIFAHGFFYNELDYDLIATDLQEPICLEDGDYEMKFKPADDHFIGFEINLTNQPEGNKGDLILTILDGDGQKIDEVLVDLSKVREASWYKVRLSKFLKKGYEYTLVFSAKNCSTVPYLQTIDLDYCTEETITGNILITYVYAESTFTFQNKVIIFVFLIAIWLFFISTFTKSSSIKNIMKYFSAAALITAALSWNYMYNSMDNQNGLFDGFQSDSERLVTSVISAEHNNIGFGDGSRYGLGFYSSGLTDYIDDDWLNNYSRDECAVVVNANSYSRMYAVEGNYIYFNNGEYAQISSVEDDGDSLIIFLDVGRILNPYKYGDIRDAKYCDSNQEIIASLYIGELGPYSSQYGLQGKIFRHLARYMVYDEVINNLHLLCCIATALVFAIIVILISIKYNNVMAYVFLYTFWLSSWIVNFARNLYWVEFTWFMPMLIGLFCSLHIESRKNRVISYVATFIAITAKCLCGYEYISVIMMGLVAFLLSDWIKAIFEKDKPRSILLFRTILIIGIIALVGFMTAICIHALLKGDGNILNGIKNIFEQDVLRRTNGADMNEFDSVYWPSFNASIWETYCKYFHFSTEVVVGINGNLFPILCIAPICIFGYEIKNKRLNVELLTMYMVFFLASISWFCLAKGHSYIHTHINFVLWYFGFVQISLYVIVNKIVEAYKNIAIRTRRDI